MNKLFLICLLLLGGLEAYSQAERKILSFSAPPYPPTARAVGATGEVEVLIAINSEGEVIAATVLSGHPLLRQFSREAALKWRFEKEAELNEMQSLTIVFSYNHGGEIKVIEKSENETEPAVRAEFSPPYRLNVLMDTLVPKLLLPRENGVIKPKICPRHDEEMEVEILDVYRDSSYGEDWEAYSEVYADAMWEYFPNANEKYYGRYLHKEIKKKRKTTFCKTCRLKREQWGFGHRLNR